MPILQISQFEKYNPNPTKKCSIKFDPEELKSSHFTGLEVAKPGDKDYLWVSLG